MTIQTTTSTTIAECTPRSTTGSSIRKRKLSRILCNSSGIISSSRSSSSNSARTRTRTSNPTLELESDRSFPPMNNSETVATIRPCTKSGKELFLRGNHRAGICAPSRVGNREAKSGFVVDLQHHQQQQQHQHQHQPTILPPRVAVFGVDARQRINLWNESAALVTGATAPQTDDSKSNNKNKNKNKNSSRCTTRSTCASTDSNPACIGLEFGRLFPSSRYGIAPSSLSRSGSFQVVLEEVIRTGQAVPNLLVTPIPPTPTSTSSSTISSSTISTSTSTISTIPPLTRNEQESKRPLDDASVGSCTQPLGSAHAMPPFSVDLLPQFDCNRDGNEIGNGNETENGDATKPRIVTGVVLVCSPAMDFPEQDGGSTTSSLSSLTAAADPIDLARHVSIAEQTPLVSPAEQTETTTGVTTGACHPRKQGVLNEAEAESEATNTPNSTITATTTTMTTRRTKAKRDSLYEDSSTDNNINNNNNNNNNESKQGTLVDTVDAIVFGVDRSGIINEWNHRIAQLTGIDAETARGLSFSDETVASVLSQGHATIACVRGEELGPLLSKALGGRSTPLVHLGIHRSSPQQQKQEQQQQRLRNAFCCDTVDTPQIDPQKDSSSSSSENDEDYSCSETIQTSNDSSKESPPNKRGDFRHLVASISPRYDSGGKEVVGAFVVALDTTPCFTDFFTIRAKANELRKLIDTANAPIFGIDAKGYVNEWNDKTAEITGYRKEDAFGCLLVDTFIFPDIQDSVRCILRDALKHGKGTSNYELEFLTQSKQIRHLLVNITPQCDMNNAVVGVVLIAQDVTEAVQRDRAVTNMALELRQLIDTANAPIFGIDVHGTVNEWNRCMADLTGFGREEAFRKPLVDTFIATSMREKVWEILEAALAGNETSNYEVEVTSKSGEPVVLLVNATTRRDPDAKVIGVVGVAQDVTEDRKHAMALREMQTLRASQEAKVETERNMTAYFAHELRNPLGAIDSALAAMPNNLPETAQSLVSGMQKCTGFMASIMNNLLDVRKMEEGKMRLARTPLSIRNLLHNVHKMLLPSVRSGVDFSKFINLTNDNDWVIGDSHRIEQVLTNVVSNAIKYTVAGHIRISIEWEGQHLRFVCEDTGPGIPTSEQPKLFQRFVQRGGAPGTGLGLAIAKHIVELIGGSIRFDSDPSVKAGTTCIVLMALPPCNPPEIIAPQKTEVIREAISVLVIDDIKMNRKMLARRIKKGIAPNATIQEAATGEEALLICGRNRFDVMIVDQFMEEAGGVMVGTDVVFAMRRMRIDSVIVGCSGNDIGAQFFDAGADMVWKKPVPCNDTIIRDLRSALVKRSDSCHR